MANVLAELFRNTANAIREKTGETGAMKPAEFPEKIRAIETGGNIGNLAPLVVTENGSYLPTTESLTFGKTYTLKDDFTQSELQTIHAKSSYVLDDAIAYLYTTEGDETIVAINHLSMGGVSGYVVQIFYFTGGLMWIPYDAAALLGYTGGWNATEDFVNFTPAQAPAITLAQTGTLFLQKLSDMNGLFILPPIDGFSSVTVDGQTGGGSADDIPAQYEELGAAFIGYETIDFGNVCFSNDGTKLYGWANNQLYTFDATDYPPTLLSTEQFPSNTGTYAWFSPDESIIAMRHTYSPYVTVYDRTTSPPTLLLDFSASHPMTNTSKTVASFAFTQNNDILCIGFASGYAVYRLGENGYTEILKKPFSSYLYRMVGLLCYDRLMIACGSTTPCIEFYAFNDDGIPQPVTVTGIDTTFSVSSIATKGNRLAMIYSIDDACFISEFEIDFDTLTATELYSSRVRMSASSSVKYFPDGDVLFSIYADKGFHRYRAIESGGYRRFPFADITFDTAPSGSTISPDGDRVVCCIKYDDNVTARYLRRME